MPRPRIFSVGYQKLTQAELVKLVPDLDCVLIDCRSYPSGRVKKGFSKKDLAAALGERYEWRGKDLGGYDKMPTPEGLARLDAEGRQGRRLMLMCKEHSPSRVPPPRGHRHAAGAEGVVVRHIFENEVIRRARSASRDRGGRCVRVRGAGRRARP